MIEIITYIVVAIFTIIGIAVTVLNFFSLSTKAINWWSLKIDKWSEKSKSKKLKKAAIKSNIEAIVNSTVFDLQKELPAKWIKKMDIKWVDKSNFKRIKDGQSIIRLQPKERQDYNVINGVYYYFNHTLFPNNFEVVPKRVFNSISLILSHRTIRNNRNSSFLIESFENTILETEIQKDNKILKFYEPFGALDEKGFMTGALVREIDQIATEIRFKERRNSFEQEILEMKDHMIEFAQKLPKAQIPNDLWYYENPSHTYKFLLARRAKKMKVYSYIRRAQQAYSDGVDRLYVFGSNDNIDFTLKLISRIRSDTNFKHTETFDLERDYRTKKKGVGALFAYSCDSGQ